MSDILVSEYDTYLGNKFRLKKFPFQLQYEIISDFSCFTKKLNPNYKQKREPKFPLKRLAKGLTAFSNWGPWHVLFKHKQRFWSN